MLLEIRVEFNSITVCSFNLDLKITALLQGICATLNVCIQALNYISII